MTNPRLLCAVAFFLTCGAATAAEPWDNFSDTWAATDGLGRSLPLAAETGPPRPDRTVAMFYFLWNGRHGDAGPFDISQILAADPSALQNKAHPAWGPLGVPHHWGESIFGHYVAEDEGVLRKHAQMLGDAGVDVIVFDVTNQLTYPESWRPLAKVFGEMRAAGNRVPQFAFLTPFWEPAKVVRELWHDLYGPGLHRDLWFQWEGKPLILADPEKFGRSVTLGAMKTPERLTPGATLRQKLTLTAGTTRVAACLPTWGEKTSAATLTLRLGGKTVATRRFEALSDNGWCTLEVPADTAGEAELGLSEPQGAVGWWSDGAQKMVRFSGLDATDAAILKTFAFRKPQPDYFTGPTGPNQWGWLEVTPQHVFRDAAGRAEQMTVGVAQNALDGKLSALSHPRSHGRSFHDGAEPPPEGRSQAGLNFAEQWKRAREVDPRVLFITGWNEWIAGRFDETAPFHGAGPVTFVDQFNEEFSRDIEPMKGGHGDAYIYQLIDGIRRWKCTRSLPAVTSRPVTIDGTFDDWREVAPEFRDTLADPMRRDSRGWGKGTRYADASGRHDLAAAKVSADSGAVHFWVRTTDAIGSPAEERWMWLFIDADADAKTGWLGFDFVVGRETSGRVRSVEKWSGHDFAWERVGEAKFATGEREMELSVPRDVLGLKPGAATLQFKWADHLEGSGDWSDFTLHGDSAPNDRFMYRAVIGN